MYIDFKIENQKLRRCDNSILAANSQNILKARFSFNNDWNDLIKKAVFEHCGIAYNVPINGDECFVPYEVLNVGFFTVGVIGISPDTDACIRATTNTVTIDVAKGPSLEAVNANKPALSEIERIESIAQSVRNDADYGLFDGVSATINIGTVESISPGENPSVTNSGTESAAILNFKLPRGKDGESLYALGSLDELKQRCLENATGTGKYTLHTVWCGEGTDISTAIGTETLSAGNIYSIIYIRSGNSIFYTSIRLIKALGAQRDLYTEAKELVSRFQPKGMKSASDLNEIDIILFAGQSNSCGRAIPSDKSSELDVFSTVDISRAFTFHDAAVKNQLDSTPQAIVEPILANGTVEDGVATFRGYVSTFLNAYYDTTGRRVCACFKSYGGQMLNKWLPYTVDASGNEIAVTDSSAYYNQMLTYINHAKAQLTANGYTVGHIYLVWCQGEADAENLGKVNDYTNVIEQALLTDEEKKSYYKSSFMRMLNSLKADTGLEKAFVIRIGHYGKTDMSNTRNRLIIEAQNELCRENDDCVMVSGLFAGAKVFRCEDGSVRNLMRDNHHYLPEGYFRAGIEAGSNAGIYVNTGAKPILLDYHRLYLDQLKEDDDTLCEREVDKYIYDPERVDISSMLKYTDYEETEEEPEIPDEPDTPDEPEDDGYILNLDFSSGKTLSDYSTELEFPDDMSGITYSADGMSTNGNLPYGIKLKEPISLDTVEDGTVTGTRAWTVEFGAILPSTASAETDYRFALFSTDNESDTSKFSPALLCQSSVKNIQLRTGYGSDEVYKGISPMFLFDDIHHDYKFVYDGDYMSAYIDGTLIERKQFGSAVKNGKSTNGSFGRVFGVYAGITSANTFAFKSGSTVKYLRIKEGTE